MVKKIKKYLKFVVCCALIMSLVAPSYAALSASDGSAFVTKAEFDSALADFNARLTTFEAGINSKIDSQVSSYLDRNGIWNGKAQMCTTAGEIQWNEKLSPGSANVNKELWWLSTEKDNCLFRRLNDTVFSLTDAYGTKYYSEVTLIPEITKSGLIAITYQVQSQVDEQRQGGNILFPQFTMFGSYAFYDMCLMAPQMTYELVFTTTDKSHIDPTTINHTKELYVQTFANFDYMPVEIAPDINPSSNKSYDQVYDVETNARNYTKEEEFASLVNNAADWKIEKLQGKKTLQISYDMNSHVIYFFVNKGEKLWLFTKLHWTWFGNRHREGWQWKAGSYIIMAAHGSGNENAKLVISADVY